MSTESQAVRELRKAATCLYIAVEEPVAKDVAKKVDAVLAELAAVNETLQLIGKQNNDLREQLAACQAERSDDKKYIEELCADLCKMEDALGFKHDCTDANGAFVPTIGPWLERVRDLIAAEGELGDVKAERNAAQAACAEMRRFIEQSDCGRKCCDGKGYMIFEGNTVERRPCEICAAKRQALSTDCGTGYVCITEALHASAPEGHKCSDCTMDKEPCPTCYAAWWKKKHPNTIQHGGTGYVSAEELEPFKEVASWAQAVLTALNVGDVAKGSPLHLKLREVMIQHRERLEALKGAK